MTTTKEGLRERLHTMLDAVPDERLDDALFALMELKIPYDDEPVTDEELEAIRQGREEYLRGELIPHDVAMREIGL